MIDQLEYKQPIVVPTAPPASPVVTSVEAAVDLSPKVQQLRYPHPNLHRLLLVLSAGLSIASVIPASRPVASLALRSIAFLSSSAICADSWEKEDVGHRMLNIARIGIVALAIVGVIAVKPVIYVASLVAEVGLQTLLLGKAIYDRDAVRALTHLGILVIDTLMLAGIVTGSWPVMAAAAGVNAAAMLIFAAKAVYEGKDLTSIIDSLCYLTLAGTSITASIQLQKWNLEKLESNHYNIKNDKDSVMEVYDSKHHHVCTLQPGESVSFDYKFNGDSTRLAYITTGPGGSNKPHMIKAAEWNCVPDIRMPLDTKHYPTLPIGGTMIVDRIQT